MLETFDMSVLRVDVCRTFDMRYPMDFRVRYAHWHVDNLVLGLQCGYYCAGSDIYSRP